MLLRNLGEVYKEGTVIMSDLYNRIEALCQSKKITVTTMCKESGTSRASLSDLKVGRKQSLSADTLSKISRYFGVSTDYLLGVENKKPAADNGSELDTQLEGIDFALYGEVKDLTDAQKRDVIKFVKFLKQKD